MNVRKLARTLPLIALAIYFLFLAASPALAQSDTKPVQPAADETNLDTQLYLIVGSNQESETSPLPAVLGPVVKHLHETLSFKSYRLAATLINRVKNEGRLSLRWVGGPLALGTVSTTPSFGEFKVDSVKLVTDNNGRIAVRMQNFSFGGRIPIQTSSAVAANPPAAPVFNYESTGLNTDISMREGEPVVVGTLNIGPSGDAIILVVSAKRTPQ